MRSPSEWWPTSNRKPSSKTGGPRLAQFKSSLVRQTATGLLRETNGVAYWTDTAANITSLDVVSQQANGFGTGSILTLYKQARA